MQRILFLSNDPALRQKSISVLAQSGFDVAEASDALQGLLMVDEDGFAAIIIDEKLADIDGYRASKKIREYSKVPIILLGTESGEKVWAAVDDLGFDIYLKKPLSPRELMCYTKAILKRTQPQKSAPEVNPAKIQATPVTPLSKAEPLQVQETVEPQKLPQEKRPAKTYVEPTAADKVAHQIQAKSPMTAEVAHAPSMSQEPYQEAAAPAQAESIKATVADLGRQVVNIKTALVRIGRLLKSIEEAKSTIRQQQQGLQAVEKQLQEISDQLEGISGSARIP